MPATAEFSPWIRFDKTSQTHFENEAAAEIETNAEALTAQTNPESAFELGWQADRLEMPVAQWFRAVQQKIAASTVPSGYVPEDAGSWLSQQVAAAALTFLAKSSYEFELAPYLYRSPSGELVAEFEEGQGRTTFIISPDSVTAFSVIEGKPVFKKRPLRHWSTNQLRIWREKISARPSGKKHGPVGS
jgi:hypothetical protein